MIKVIDSGAGFDAERVPLPDPVADNGRGLLIMRALADDVRFSSFAEDGALVALEKRLTYGEDSLGGALTARRTTPAATGADLETGDFATGLFELARAATPSGCSPSSRPGRR